MTRDEAKEILCEHLNRLEGRGYERLAAIVGHVETQVVTTPQGGRYQIEIPVFWDAREGGAVRLLGSIDDGGWRAFAPFTEDRLVNP